MKNRKNTFSQKYFLIIFVGITITTVFFAVSKSFTAQQKYIYAKVKIGQGLWWAQTEKPQFWLAAGLKKGAEIIETRYYPSGNNDEFEIYVSLKLRGSFDKKRGRFYFNRSFVKVGSPLNLDLQTVQISGTIIALSNEPFKYIYEQKNITLVKKLVGSEFQNAEIGDAYFDGTEPVFEIKNKEIYQNEGGEYMRITANIKVKKTNEQLIFGESRIVITGRSLPLFTEKINLRDFIVDSIE